MLFLHCERNIFVRVQAGISLQEEPQKEGHLGRKDDRHAKME
jgi:hypothetical protein